MHLGANLIIHIMPLAPFGPFAIPNENIRRCPGGQRRNPNDRQLTGPHRSVGVHHPNSRDLQRGGENYEPVILNSTGRLKAHNWANWLHHPYLLEVSMVGRNRCRKRVDVVEMSKKKCVQKSKNG